RDRPPLELHASPHCDIRSVEKARFLADVGFTRLVLPRELSLEETRAIHEAVPSTELEEFIHGALCVSYSGDCRASFMTCGRSANRGECAQICRLPFTLTDPQGRVLVKDRHLLSLRDLNRSDSLADMADAGVSSFKIEGRLKDEGYVRNTVAWYSRLLDRVVEQSAGRYCRQSFGRPHQGFTPDPGRSFNRGFTTYFLNGRAPSAGLASLDTPKAIGQPVGSVVRCEGRSITARLTTPLANGDGLGYFDATGRFCGFRLNRVEGNRLFPASPCDIPAGTQLYRNRDKEWDDVIASAKASRTMALDMELRTAGGNLVLTLSDERGLSVSATSQGVQLTPAVTPQEAPRRRVLEKLGDTRYRARQVIDLVGDLFIPASALTALRRRAVEMLDTAAVTTYPFRYRLPEKVDAVYPSDTLSIHDNVANRKAAEFYRSHGVKTITPAVETATETDKRGETHVMCTRYCLRRELGKCLLTPEGRRWGGGGSLYLQAKGGDRRFRV
ncbi:MAG: U32 family peptidase, partial [Duncaniella sp.]|nr:U32 family peptidase [Duncaniella sp.]